jgi:large subunit ribosomal protein L5
MAKAKEEKESKKNKGGKPREKSQEKPREKSQDKLDAKTPEKRKVKVVSEEGYVPRLKEKYLGSIVPSLIEKFGYKNRFQVPRLEKVVLNVGMGKAIQNAKLLDAAVKELALITGQQPIVTRAKKSIASFKIRAGMPIGCAVTLRGERMYEFLDRLCSMALPRIRDFRGLSDKSFDGRGNYTFGIKEQLIFPEINYDDTMGTHGMDITIVTTARSNPEGKLLLDLLGVPFRAA